ncbi:hypothetical protein PUN28_002502 [Cardiocondyla obscurior]|uniref:Secreted protein n=1 Tax=Cardiocondyla obscurior TaxID=286306 RepID=A0AAW2GUK8_9HYME
MIPLLPLVGSAGIFGKGASPPATTSTCRTHLPHRNDHHTKRGTRRRVRYPVVDAGHIACSFPLPTSLS